MARQSEFPNRDIRQEKTTPGSSLRNAELHIDLHGQLHVQPEKRAAIEQKAFIHAASTAFFLFFALPSAALSFAISFITWS